jgi:ABC-type multidrug transport system fused ATPase/permease subunit
VAAAVAAAVDGSPGVTPSLLGGWEGAGSSGGSYGGAALMGGGGGSGSGSGSSVGAGAVAEDTPPMAIVLDDNGNPSMHTLQGAIEFKDVVFDYPKGDKDDKDITSRSRKRKAAAVRSSEDGSSSSSGPKTPVLNGFSFKVEPGQRVGIVGPSGGGKSTLLRLISGHYRPTSGSLLIDGIDSSCFSARHLRRCIGYVEQKPVLMSERSVYENIVYGMKEPWPSMERVEAASRDAAIHDTIVGKWAEEGGYEAKIGMDGLDPSGGEQQRLVIARALVRRPSLLLLDESTSSLDAPSEKLVTDAMEKAMRGRTTIMIAHRLCTTQHCDKIIFMSASGCRARLCCPSLLCHCQRLTLSHAHAPHTPLSEDGRVQEEGTHLELMAKRGDYYAYIQPQIIQSG